MSLQLEQIIGDAWENRANINTSTAELIFFITPKFIQT